MLRGTATVAGLDCLDSGEVTGLLNDTSIDIALTAVGPQGTTAEATYTGFVSGESMTGTFTTSCGDAGGWELAKS